MIGKIADPGEDLMPWVEVIDSTLHGNLEEERISISNLTPVLQR
jgi:hypothetical protein